MELCLQNCGLQMTSENFEEIFQLIKDNTLEEKLNLRELMGVFQNLCFLRWTDLIGFKAWY